MWTSILRPQMSIITVTKIWQIKFQKIDQCTGQIGADSIRASAEDLHKYGRPTKYSRWSLSEKQQYWRKLIRQRVKIVFKKIRNGSVANQPQEKNWQSKIGLNLGEFVVSLLYFQLSFFQSISITSMQDRGWWLIMWVQRTRFLQQFSKSKIRAETLQTFLKIKCTKGWAPLLPVAMQRILWIMILSMQFYVCVATLSS